MHEFEIFIPFEKSVSPEGELKLFGGIASSTATDRDLERMDKAVLVKIADGLKKNSTVFFNHDTKGLGVGTVAHSEVRGDEVYIDVVPTKAAAMKDVVTQIQEGILKSFSIGGKILAYENEFDEKLGKSVRVIKDVDCYEVSVVGIPSNKDASILSYIAKSFKGDTLEAEKKGDEATKAAPAPSTAPAVGTPAKMFKCTKCGEMNKLEEPAQGPHEGMKSAEILETPEFKKVFDDFGSKIDTLEKSYKAKLDEQSLAIEALKARNEELHKSIEGKVKALEAEEQALTKSAEKDTKETDKGETFSAFPTVKKS